MGGAFASAFFSVVGVLIFIVAPVAALVGIYETLRFTWLGLSETFEVSTSETMGNIIRFLAKIAGRVFIRWLIPLLTAGALALVLPLLLSQAIGALFSMVINVFWKDKKKPHIAYLFVLVDTAYAGYDGSLLPSVRTVITTIKPAWTFGVVGVFIVVAAFTFLTGVWSIFSTKKQ